MNTTPSSLWTSRLRDAGLPAAWPSQDSRFAPLAALLSADIAELEESRRTVDGFASHMAECFDTIDTLYGIGREMHDVTQPARFFDVVVNRLLKVMDFEWIGLVFCDDTRCARPLRGICRICAAPGGASPRDGGFASALLSTSIDCRNPVVPDPCTPSKSAVLQVVRSKGQPIGVLIAGCKRGKDQEISSYDIQLLEATAGLLSAFCENVVLYDEQRQMFLGTVRALSAAIDAKDRYTCGHSERVAFLCGQIAVALKLSDTEADLARLAGLVHDVGKIGVPEAVLTKPGRLTDVEFEGIKQHPEIGHRILGGIPPLSAILPAVLHHHERFDGRGYPSGLAGRDIPFMARIVSVADTFDAMSSDRSYRPALPRARVLAEMTASGGKQLDADIVSAFTSIDFSGYDALIRTAAARAA